jgi:bifunctional non-homologous end joining protein LigD
MTRTTSSASDTVEVDGIEIRLSHRDKVLFPADGITKGDVVTYYRSVAGVLLPHVAGRPLNVRRFPDGIERGGFFQQHAGDHVPDWVRTVDVPARGDQAPVRHVVCDNEATLVFLANLACLELHRWLSTADAPGAPTLLVVDLDPPEGATVARLRDAATSMRDVFEEVGLVPFVQTTGGRGFHVVAPLDGTRDEEFVRPLARAVADHLADRAPDRFTTQQRKAKRGDRIFLDTNRNGYGQTAVAPYSLRARPGAPAATPIGWDELARVTPDRYGLRNLSRRLARKADPWRDIQRHARSARDVADRLAERIREA